MMCHCKTFKINVPESWQQKGGSIRCLLTTTPQFLTMIGTAGRTHSRSLGREATSLSSSGSECMSGRIRGGVQASLSSSGSAPIKGVLQHSSEHSGLISHPNESSAKIRTCSTNKKKYKYTPLNKRSIADRGGGALVKKLSSETAASTAASSISLSLNQQGTEHAQQKTTTIQRGGTRVHRHVGFGSVQVREYARTVGDNPSVSSGPPLAYVQLLFPGATNARPFQLFSSHLSISMIPSLPPVASTGRTFPRSRVTRSTTMKPCTIVFVVRKRSWLSRA
jgi:hypothetical protein